MNWRRRSSRSGLIPRRRRRRGRGFDLPLNGSQITTLNLAHFLHGGDGLLDGDVRVCGLRIDRAAGSANSIMRSIRGQTNLSETGSSVRRGPGRVGNLWN